MLFIVVAAGLTEKRGAATITCIVQALLVLVTGVTGSHGIFSLVTYTLPGVMVDLLLLVIRHRGCCRLCCFFAGMTANVTGTLLTNVVFFRLPLIPLLLMLFAAALSGGLGGLIAHGIIGRIKKLIPVFSGSKMNKGNGKNEE